MKMFSVVLSSVLGVAMIGLAGTGDRKPTESAAPADHRDSQTQAPNVAIRLTYGPGGSTRPPEVIAGEDLNVAINVQDLDAAPTGMVAVVIEADLVDPAGKVVSYVPASRREYTSWFGDRSIIAFLTMRIPANLAPGTYHVRVRARDARKVEQVAASAAVLVQPPTTFGAVNICLFADPNGRFPARGVFPVSGEPGVFFSVVGFDTTGDRVCVESKLSALDENGKSVSPRPTEITFDRRLTDPAERVRLDRGLPTSFYIGLTRPGRFRLRLEFKDCIGEQSAVYEIPIVVVPSP